MGTREYLGKLSLDQLRYARDAAAEMIAELEKEQKMVECPKQGVLDDDGKPTHYTHIAYFEEYLEEGSFPLGDELAPPNAALTGAATDG